VVDVRIGPGFWCYCGVALSLLIAERSFDFDSSAPAAPAGGSGAAAKP
jgi:hypothetical protein